MKFDCLKNEFEKIWKTDKKMVDYCIKSISGFVTFENGKIFKFEKPSIETHFCFGHGQNGITTEDDFKSACEGAENAKKKENFIASNMEIFNKYDFTKKLYAFEQYNTTSNFVCLYSEEYLIAHPFMKDHILFELTAKDKEILEKELNRQKEMFLKRLETYWKKYGSSKLKTWTYLVD